MALFQGVVHLTEAQYQDLIANGSITYGGQTLQYNRNTLYVTDKMLPTFSLQNGVLTITTDGE